MFFLIQTKQTGIEVGGALVSFEGGEGGEEEIRAGHCVRNRFRVGGKGIGSTCEERDDGKSKKKNHSTLKSKSTGTWIYRIKVAKVAYNVNKMTTRYIITTIIYLHYLCNIHVHMNHIHIMSATLVQHFTPPPYISPFFYKNKSKWVRR